MRRLLIIQSTRTPLYPSHITILTHDGRSYSTLATGREFVSDFNEEARGVRGFTGGVPISAARFDDEIPACRNLIEDALADHLIGPTLRG